MLFLEAVDFSSEPFSDTHQRVMMRHVCTVPSSWLGNEEVEMAGTEKVDVEQSRLPASAQELDGSAGPSSVLSLSDDANQRKRLKRRMRNRRKRKARAKRRKLNGVNREEDLC